MQEQHHFKKKLYTGLMILIKLICFWIVGWTILRMGKENIVVLMVVAKLIERVANEVLQVIAGLEIWGTTNWWLKSKEGLSINDVLSALIVVVLPWLRLSALPPLLLGGIWLVGSFLDLLCLELRHCNIV